MKPTKTAGLGAERKQIQEKPQPKPLSWEVCKLVPETRAAWMATQSLWQVCQGQRSDPGQRPAPPRSLWHHMPVPHSHPRVTTQQPLGVTQAAADANLLGWGVDAPPATQQRTCQSGKPGSHCPGVCQNSGPVPWSPPARETQSGTLAGCASTHRVLRETGISSPGGPTACREWGRKQGALGLAL